MAKRKRLVQASNSHSERYEINAILDERHDGDFLVSWVGYDSSDNTWESGSALPQALIRRYQKHVSQQLAKGEARRLSRKSVRSARNLRRLQCLTTSLKWKLF